VREVASCGNIQMAMTLSLNPISICLSFICPGHVLDMSADRTNDRLFSGHADLSGHAPDRDCP
jgi:hypothetical protein